jgi:uncharacterized protein YbaP (TraB family)
LINRDLKHLAPVLIALLLNVSVGHALAESDGSEEKSKESTTATTSPDTLPAGQSETTTKTPESTNTGETNSSANIQHNRMFMWKATRGSQTIYLLGTIHIARPEFYPLPVPIETALNQADSLIVELATDRLDKNDLQKLVQGSATYSAGDSLEKHLSPETKEALNSYLAWSGESLAMYNDYKPWLVQLLLESAALRREGFAADLGIDQHLLGKAKKKGKKVLELETAGSQLKALSSATDAQQDRLLLMSLRGLKKLSERIQQFEKAWRSGDDEAMLKATKVDAKSDGLDEFYNEVIQKRNVSMMEKLYELAQGQSTVLCAVGAAHLVGEQGIPALIKSKGFSVEQVTTDAAVAAMPTISGRARKLQNLFYPEGMFSVALPGNPNVKYVDVAGLRCVDYTYPEFAGLYQVSYIVLPREINAAVQTKMYDAVAADLVKKSHGTLIRNYATTQQGRPARQVDIKTIVTQKVGMKPQAVLMRLKMVAAGKRFYMIGGTGTAAWLSSPAVVDFMNSLSIRGESQTATSPYSLTQKSSSLMNRSQSLSKSSEDFHRDFAARRKEFDQKFAVSRSNARKSFEGARAAHERDWGR